MPHQIIHIHPDAPSKPVPGAACNGCGVCCMAAPCPIGVLVSGSRSGACAALLWVPEDARYRCGMAGSPEVVLPRLPRPLVPLVRRLSLRWISAASGCDSDLIVEPTAPPVDALRA